MPFQPPRGLKRALQSGDPKYGMFIGTSSVQMAELTAVAGMDFLVVDLEHGHDVETASAGDLIRAAAMTQTPVIVRVPANTPNAIGSVLDQGAIGVCIPHVRNRAEAALAVAHARYAPVGVRAMSPLVRAAGYSAEGWDDYWRIANDEIIVMVLVEDMEALSNLDEIASTPGVDVVWIGPGDLSQDAGIPFQMDHPTVVDAMQAGLDAAQRHGRISFMAIGQSPIASRDQRVSELADMHRRGYTMIAWLDTPTYSAAVSELLAARVTAAVPST